MFFSRKRGADSSMKAISRVQAWTILKAASERADELQMAYLTVGDEEARQLMQDGPE
jgi:hypothetical protein